MRANITLAREQSLFNLMLNVVLTFKEYKTKNTCVTFSKTVNFV